MAIVLLMRHSMLAGALAPDFTVSVTGVTQRQEQDKIWPVITIPTNPAASGPWELDMPTGSYFYVVVTNTSGKSIRLNLNQADWYYCLGFQITAPNGKIFSIHRPAALWAKNTMRPWIFQPGGMRIFTVDFTTGLWQGFPSEKDLPRDGVFKIKATFQYEKLEKEKDMPMEYKSGDVDARSKVY